MLTSLLAIICTIHIQMWVQTCTTDFFDNLHAPLSITVSLEEVVNLSYTSQLIFKLTIVESFSNYPRSELFNKEIKNWDLIPCKMSSRWTLLKKLNVSGHIHKRQRDHCWLECDLSFYIVMSLSGSLSFSKQIHGLGVRGNVQTLTHLWNKVIYIL